MTVSCDFIWAMASRRSSASKAPKKCSMSTQTVGMTTPSLSACFNSSRRGAASDAQAARHRLGAAADWGEDGLQAVGVELVSQPQADAVSLVEAGGHHAAADGDRAQGLVQGRVGTADLDGEVGAESCGGF